MKAEFAIAMGATFAVISAGAWFGCGSDSTRNSTDAGASSSSSGGSSSSSSGGTDGSPMVLTWTQVYADVVAGPCAACHCTTPDGGLRSGLRVGKLDLTTVDAGWANLINVAAQGTSVPAPGYTDAAVCNTLEAGVSGSMRVVPGDAGASLLFLKMQSFDVPPPCGAPMPEPVRGQGAIPDGGQAAAAAEIMTWINQGALP